MKIVLLGTGTPIPDITRMGPATLIEIQGHYLLFDTGRGVTLQLVKSSTPLERIGLIFITHFHQDHIQDLGDVLLSIWKSGRNDEIQIFGPHGISDIVSALLNTVFSYDINYSIALEKISKNAKSDLRKLVIIHEIQPGIIFQTNDFQVHSEYVEHGQKFLGFNYKNWPSFAFKIHSSETDVVVSGDTIINDEFRKFVQDSDALIQCCYLSSNEITTTEFELLSTHILASSRFMGNFAEESNIKVLILTHFRKKDDLYIDYIEKEIKNTFHGQLYLGKDFLTINL